MHINHGSMSQTHVDPFSPWPMTHWPRCHYLVLHKPEFLLLLTKGKHVKDEAMYEKQNNIAHVCFVWKWKKLENLLKYPLVNETLWPETETRPRRLKNTSRDRLETETTTLPRAPGLHSLIICFWSVIAATYWYSSHVLLSIQFSILYTGNDWLFLCYKQIKHKITFLIL